MKTMRLLAAVTAVLVWPCTVFVAEPFRIDEGAAIESILVGDWEDAFATLEAIPDTSRSPVECFLSAHAGLATNRNNEALTLLTSDSASAGVQSWSIRTSRLLGMHRDNPIAWFLAADAEARRGNVDSAMVMLRTGLGLDPDNRCLLNAYGTVWAMEQNWDSSLYYISRAIAVDPDFADAWAGRGAVLIKSRNGATGALADFERALKLSPDFSLALNGRACAEFAAGEWDAAQTDLVAAFDVCPGGEIARVNMLVLTAARLATAVDSTTDEDAKMSMQRVALNLQRIGHTMGALGDIGAHAVYGTLRDLNASTKVEFQRGRDGLKVGAGLQINPHWASIAENAQSLITSDMERHFDAMHSIDNELANLPPGGVIVDLRGAYVDAGNWLDTWMGLGYAVAAADRTAGN